MIQGILIWLLTLTLSFFIIGLLQQQHKKLDRKFMIALFFYHSLLALAYYLYAVNNPSDSKNYFLRVDILYYGEDWFEYYGTSTKFIDFIAFFLVNKLGFTYESCMAFFAWLGFLGFIFFYIFFTERIKTKPKIFGVDGISFLLLLPNLHFWSSSLGKGSIIFCGFGLFFYSLNKPGLRFWAMIIGGWIIFQIRPHIFYVILIAIGLGYTFSTKGVAIVYRVLILMTALIILAYIYQDILALTGLEDESVFDATISHRAKELSKATSGIDLVNYSVPEKLFAFWFRPLFFDASGLLSIIVSFENFFYLIFFARLLFPSGLKYMLTADAITKTSLLTFFGVSYALAQISGNLGLAMRQKSQVMILMLFVILKFMDEQRILQIRKTMTRRKMQERIKAQVSNIRSQGSSGKT